MIKVLENYGECLTKLNFHILVNKTFTTFRYTVYCFKKQKHCQNIKPKACTISSRAMLKISICLPRQRSQTNCDLAEKCVGSKKSESKNRNLLKKPIIIFKKLKNFFTQSP